MIPIDKLNFGFSDAENYRRRENKNLFNSIFIKTEALEELTKKNVYFLVGEKGTGKTAYALFFENNRHNNTISKLNYVRERDCLNNCVSDLKIYFMFKEVLTWTEQRTRVAI
ncbi:MAG: hypothetical protein HZA04_03110 [Nitrospinae bacterium]|nr:hypothetical protein [Nitrospinota bacterium]